MGDFEDWVTARSGALARTAYLLTGDVQLAEDLVQETLARVAQHWRRLDRHHGPDDQDAAVEQRVVLRTALLRLTARQRAVLSLRFLEDLTEVQSATVLGCSVSTVKSQTRDALARLRALAPDLLVDLGPGPLQPTLETEVQR